MTFLLAIVLLGVLIFVHELGHFLFAKLMDVKVEKFSIGFGPVLLSKTVGETEYSLAAIPFGGFVKMLGENPEEDEPKEGDGGDEGKEDDGDEKKELKPLSPEELERSFAHKPVSKRFLIVVMGPVFNIAFAVFLYWAIFMAGFPTLTAELGNIAVDTPAASAGLLEGDVIVSIDGQATPDWFEMTTIIKANPGREMLFVIRRGESEIEKTIAPAAVMGKSIFGEEEEMGRLGVASAGTTVNVRYGPLSAMGKSLERCQMITSLTFTALKKLIQRTIPADTMGGPVMIVQMAQKRASQGAMAFFDMMALISISLGIFNLFPIPILDGGVILFMGLEAVRRKPVSENVQLAAQKVGLAVLLTLMVFVTYNDLVRIFTGQGLP
ncbi:MAG: RIP metalloprotease RseP [Thermodesulfovibrionales bacterium]|nr:RIP metalloprotease RseP [Thermodesulfovibrionales bacterium]